MRSLLSLPLALVCCLAVAAGAWAEDKSPRVLPEGKLPDDTRLEKLKDYDGYFPWTPSKSPQEWRVRAERVTRQMSVALGILPQPLRTALNPIIVERKKFADYTVSGVAFESVPGHFVTGNLYWPNEEEEPRKNVPVVLCPHGHWSNGRFHDAGEKAVQREIEQGAERFEEGGRSPLQARCVQLARMGCAVFHYDMIGYADSTQLSFELAHRFAKQRPEMNTRENWGFYSTPAESRLQSIMGLQTWNSIRALDFVLELPGVDKSRVGVTGSSGGGTQTMILAALDDRVTVAWPAVMVSTSMQGGCTCENCSLLRVHTGNIEFAALMAPRPQGISSANDWTKEMETKGFPDLKAHYTMLGAADNITHKPLIQFGHNFNYVSRAAMYSWFNKHFRLGLEEPIVEQDYPRLTAEELTVWGGEHPRPAGGDDYERKLVRQLTEESERQLAAITPRDSETLGQFRRVVGGAIDAIVGREVPAAGKVVYEQTIKHDRGEFFEMAGLLQHTPRADARETLPIVFLHPKEWKGRVALWLTERGKAGLYAADGRPRDAVRQLLEQGATVVGVDLMGQGEFLPDGQPITETRKVPNQREFAGYTFGYNDPLLVQRAHDVLTVVSYVRHHELTPQRVDLIALDETSPIAVLARAQGRGAFDRAAIVTGGFRFADLLSWRDPRFVPGGAKYGDLPGLLALAAPHPTWVAREKQPPTLAVAAYESTGAKDALAIGPAAAEPQALEAAALKWLQGE